MLPSLYRIALVLGLITLTGPLAIDMYLPALPSIADSLNASTVEVQASLMVFMAAMAICQIVYGPVSDMVGRKPPLYFGIALFVLGSLGAAFSPNVGFLILSRLVQGIGVSAAMSLPRAIVRDYYTGTEAARLMALLMLVISVGPLLAPLAGSLIIKVGDWRLIFVIMTGIGVLGALLIMFGLDETRPPEKRLESSLKSAFTAYGILIRDHYFLGLCLISGFGMASFFAFLITSSFVYIEHYGLTPTQYSLAFSVNAIGFFGFSQLTANFARRFGFVPLVRTAIGSYFMVMTILLILVSVGFTSLPVLMVCLFCGFASLGLVIPSTAVLALDPHGPIAGSASALLGTLQMVTAAIIMAVVGAFFDGTPSAMVLGIFFCSGAAALTTALTLGVGRSVPAE